jgi:hypothetical protein
MSSKVGLRAIQLADIAGGGNIDPLALAFY